MRSYRGREKKKKTHNTPSESCQIKLYGQNGNLYL